MDTEQDRACEMYTLIAFLTRIATKENIDKALRIVTIVFAVILAQQALVFAANKLSLLR